MRRHFLISFAAFQSHVTAMPHLGSVRSLPKSPKSIASVLQGSPELPSNTINLKYAQPSPRLLGTVLASSQNKVISDGDFDENLLAVEVGVGNGLFEITFRCG